MNYLNRVWIAASVAVVQGHTDQAKLRSLQLNRRRFSSSGGDSAGLRSLAGAAAGLVLTGLVGNCEDRIRQADESIQRVMYLNCWGQG
ncbi:Wound-responsive family protein [Parasponia andersonii]|uniref:Wound-responsive family protein n=1 Tax=Parasponia andersonii TaxID=3476 RepID=A0A2P5E4V3_PARAD|nr:Wound-responsive family protein [Parasponia andersonii]